MTATQTRLGSGFDAHCTADDVLAGIDLSGRTAIVTGGYSGLGLEITRSLTSAGATVIVLARRPDSARRALAGIDRLTVVACDLSDLASVERCARDILADTGAIDILICNAGIMAVPLTRVGPGWESHFAINHLGHFALVNHLAPALGAGARVVSVSSAGHFLSPIRWDDPHFHTDYDRWVAYGQAKTASALFAVHLSALMAPRGAHAFAVHPGSILTPLQRHIPLDEQIELGWRTTSGEPAAGFKTSQQGAATAVWAATAPELANHGGTYLQDCKIAALADTDDMLVGGVKPWAIDPVEAERLWALSSSMAGVDGGRFILPDVTQSLPPT